jgi:uncharacterized YigZ family protein
MIDAYLTLKEPVTSRLARKKSRFIGLLSPVSTTSAVEETLQRVRQQHHDAAHHCYAYRLMGDSGPIVYTNDAGEPAGSAGGPILQQVEASDLYDVLAIVVRYFGGKKLGLGGLIRAYGDTVKDALGDATIVERQRTVRLAIDFPPEMSANIMRLVHRHTTEVETVRYDSEAHLLVTLPPSQLQAFVEALQEASRAQARWKEIR